MLRSQIRKGWLWALLGVAGVVGAVVPLVVLAGSQGELTVTPYSDVIRFEAPGVASLQVQIFDLSGKLLWDSGVVSGAIVDWDRADKTGERLAYGAYLYLVQGWDGTGKAVLLKKGKLSLLPGDKLKLQQAPDITPGPSAPSLSEPPITLQPLTYTINDDLVVNGKITSQESGTVSNFLDVKAGSSGDRAGFRLFGYNASNAGDYAVFTLRTDYADAVFSVYDASGGTWHPAYRFFYLQNKYDFKNNQVVNVGKLGVGTTSPTGKVHINNAADQPALKIEASNGTNLIEAYNTGSGTATGLIFRVERETGDVHATGAFYGSGFYTGSADVAEHINVSEPVEPGDVVEIDPENPGHFRKARGPYSRLVAGVISTDPGLVLGSNSDPVEGKGDPRPVLALAGRVRVKATTENGPIQVGDLLVAASKPGYAMRCDDPRKAVGAVIGKALEPLEEGEGTILIQVTLR